MVSKKALIVRLNAIGDIVEAIPGVHALYKEGLEIHWICGKTVLPIIECYSWINPIPVDDKKILVGTLFERISSILGLWSKLFFQRYELCAVLNYDWRYRVLALPVIAKRRLSLSHRSRNTDLISSRNRAEEYVRLLVGVEDGCRETGHQPVYPEKLPPPSLPELKVKPRIAIVPGGASNIHHKEPLRRWPIEMYVELAKRIVGRGWEIILLGGGDDSWVRSYFQGLDIVDCIGKQSLPEVISTCNVCDAVISHDTGPLHLAGLTRTCLIGIFGPTDPGRVLPRREGVVGIWGGQGFACRPCYDGHSYAPCEFTGCMYQVTPELVIRELDQLLEAKSENNLKPWRIVFP